MSYIWNERLIDLGASPLSAALCKSWSPRMHCSSLTSSECRLSSPHLLSCKGLISESTHTRTHTRTRTLSERKMAAKQNEAQVLIRISDHVCEFACKGVRLLFTAVPPIPVQPIYIQAFVFGSIVSVPTPGQGACGLLCIFRSPACHYDVR